MEADESSNTKVERNLTNVTRSLDDIIKENKPQRYNNQSKSHQFKARKHQDVPAISALESSLDDIVKTNKPNYIKKGHNHSPKQSFKHKSDIKITIRNDGQANDRNGNFHSNNNNELIQNRGLFNRNNRNNRYNNNDNHQNNGMKKKNPIYTEKRLPPPIDHTQFDPRGIKDYSQVKRPTIVHGRVVIDLEEKDDFDENVYRITVSNLPQNIIPSDLASLFSPFGSLKDFEINKSKGEAYVLFKKKRDALSAIERYNNVELDNCSLILTESFIINKPTKEDIQIQFDNDKFKENTTANTSEQTNFSGTNSPTLPPNQIDEQTSYNNDDYDMMDL